MNDGTTEKRSGNWIGMLGMDVPVRMVEKLDPSRFRPGEFHRFLVKLVEDPLGLPITVPVMVAHGREPGPTLGITAAVHGNELNGIPVIQRLFREIDPRSLRGTIIGIPVVNVPGFIQMQRRFNDDSDLNRLMPGRSDGNNSEVFAHRLLERAMFPIDYLLDLHTASFGRVNSYYIRANMEDPVTRELAIIQNSQIIVNSPAPDSTLRGTLQERGVKAITLEVGDPNRFQKRLIRSGLEGVHNSIIMLGMLDGDIEAPDEAPVFCSNSYWIYTDAGGLLTVHPQVTERVHAGEEIASLRNVFGDVVHTYRAPEDGIVIGKSIHPTAQTGSRILHLGIV